MRQAFTFLFAAQVHRLGDGVFAVGVGKCGIHISSVYGFFILHFRIYFKLNVFVRSQNGESCLLPILH